jgi:TonB family protein
MRAFVLFSVLCLFCSNSWSQSAEISSPNQRAVRTFVAPPFPIVARHSRIQGKAVVRLTITKEGRVSNTVLVSSHPVFQQQVERALQQWVFEPSAGQTIEDVTVSFEFTDSCETTETFVSADLPNLVHVQTGSGCITTSVN